MYKASLKPDDGTYYESYNWKVGRPRPLSAHIDTVSNI